MRNICQISTVLPPSKDGVGASALKIHNLLKHHGYDSIILTSFDQKKQLGIYTVIKKWTIFQLYKEIKKIVKSTFSTIIFHYPSPKIKHKHFIVFISLLLKIKKIPFIVYLHEFAVYKCKGRLKIIFLILFAEKIITTDEINLYELKRLPYIKRKVYKLPTGSNFIFDSKEFVNNKFKINSTDTVNIAFWGFIMKGKGIQKYINAANNFEFEKVKFYFIGDVPESPSNEDINLKNKLLNSKKIEFLGFLNDEELIRKLQEIQIIILPFEDGVSERRSSFMLAMQLGRVVLTTTPKYKISGLINNVNVLFIENCLDDLKLKIINLIESPLLLKSIADNARTWYQSNHSDEKFFESLIRIINNQI